MRRRLEAMLEGLTREQHRETIAGAIVDLDGRIAEAVERNHALTREAWEFATRHGLIE